MRELVLKSCKYFLFLFLFLTVSSACEKIQDSIIPSIPFSYTINLTIHNEVNIPGNSIFISNIGYGGVIVYCEFPGSFYAFDATCTNEVSPSCQVENVGVLGTCKCCQSLFLLSGGGFPSKGPAVEGLRQYQTSLVNGMLRIYNQ
jgi:Rieske Fe-S protein